MQRIKKIILNTLVAGVILYFVLFIFFWIATPCPDFLNKGFCGCSPSMPGPCPDNWDPINECIKGEDCPD